MKKFNKGIMVASGILNGILGIVLTFLPQEIGGWLGLASETEAGVLAFQLLGGALFGLGLINYMGRNAILGGIYGKPILLGNMVFHFIAALDLIRFIFDADQFGFLMVVAMLYTFLAAAFIRMNFTSAA
ncbi:hypothetical protein [Rhodohalobacter sp. 614A]|uniref:hypothetical protein n=1 Tax=Rhodohalobacter sp. 614A TaxID=2908649 RepID=UPI001F24797F|nr:hypothetical protein [Rhodohalobacter sp. 614A]